MLSQLCKSPLSKSCFLSLQKEQWTSSIFFDTGIEGEHGDTIPTPFGNISRGALDELRNNEEMQSNPKFAALQEEMKRDGPMAIMKYMNDPEVMDVMGKFTNLFGPGGAPPQQ